MGIFVETVGQYKSTWYETARSLFRSRNTQRAKADLVRASLSSVSVKQMNEWVTTNPGKTMTSKRATAYKKICISRLRLARKHCRNHFQQPRQRVAYSL